MKNIDWNNLKEADLVGDDDLVKAFKKFLKKVCKYTTEEANFAADVILDHTVIGEYENETKYIKNVQINGIDYEVWSCATEDCGGTFDFYIFVDVVSLNEHLNDENYKYSDKEQRAYRLAHTKYVI